MKTDRILEIIIYLTNHDRVSARALAERFHVSQRTIQRDIDCIQRIGVPLYADGGRNGGYSVVPSYKVQNGTVSGDEQALIVRALESLATSYTSDTLSSLIEKYNAIVEVQGGQKVFWDFSVTRENSLVQDANRLLERAISNREHVHFSYTNASGQKSDCRVEPLAIHYKWYAWYLFAYLPNKQQYRTFKVARMQNVHADGTHSAVRHRDVQTLMAESEQAYYRTCIKIEVHFADEDAPLMAEYFPDCKSESVAPGTSRIFIDVPAKERLWKALLLSFGSRVKIIAPQSYREELAQTAREFFEKNG